MTKAQRIARTLLDQVATINVQRTTILNQGTEIRGLRKEVEAVRDSHQVISRRVTELEAVERKLTKLREENQTLIVSLINYITRTFQ